MWVRSCFASARSTDVSALCSHPFLVPLLVESLSAVSVTRRSNVVSLVCGRVGNREAQDDVPCAVRGSSGSSSYRQSTRAAQGPTYTRTHRHTRELQEWQVRLIGVWRYMCRRKRTVQDVPPSQAETQMSPRASACISRQIKKQLPQEAWQVSRRETTGSSRRDRVQPVQAQRLQAS